MNKEQEDEMDVNGSAEPRTALVELSSNTDKHVDQEENYTSCGSNTMQIHSDAFIKEEPSEKGIEEDANCMDGIDDREGKQCIDSNTLLESRGSSCDSGVYGRLYLGDNVSQVIFYNSAVSECSSENMEHASESDKNSVTDSSNPNEGELYVEDNKKPSSSHSKHSAKSSSGEKSFICPVEGCGRNFTSSGHLKYHHSTHSGEKPFKCQHPGCDRMFAWPAHLKYHLKTHSGDRPFRCTFEGCGKTFYVLQRLNVHLRVHTGERPYTCDVENCKKSFTTAGNLKNHMRIHTGERPYVCPFVTCGRSFTEHSSLRKHKLRHTGEKPYLCEICGKCFSQSGSRNAHEKRHALENPPRFKDSASMTVVQKDNDLEQNEQDSPSVDSGEEESNLIYSSDMGCKITTSDQVILAQPMVAKEVSIETTPVQSLQTVVQNVAEELISSQQQVLPQSSACVVSLAETVVAQQALIQSMLDGTAVVPVTQSGSSDELTVVDHPLQHQDVEQIMQSVVSQHILGSQIQLPISGDDVTHDQGTLTVEVPTFMVQSHSQNVLLNQHEQEDIDSLENEQTMIVTTEPNEVVLQ